MAFTEKNMQEQEAKLSVLKDELFRLNQQFEDQMKRMGLSEEDLKQESAMTPELEELKAQIMEKAKREGEARRTHALMENRPSSHAPGAGRRGVVRL